MATITQTRQDVFTRDLERMNGALQDGGHVLTITDEDGTEYQCLAPETPESLARPYQALQAYGYANGLL